MLNQIKKQIKKTSLFTYYRNKRNSYKLNKLTTIASQETIFSMDIIPDSRDALYARLRLLIHGMEKALVKGQIPKLKSISALISLADILFEKYPDYPKHSDAVVETIGMAQRVIISNQEVGEDCSNAEKELFHFIEKNNLEGIVPRIINILNITDNEKPKDLSEQYDSFICNRHSVREFTSEIIDEELLKNIIRTALICPSACNRQPCKVYYSKVPESIRDLFPDKNVTKDVYNLLVITVNKSFYNSYEIFQPWIDGGIFAESLIMSIHSRGLGACLFQYIKTNPNYSKLKGRIGIPNNEDIICCVGIGYLKDGYSVIETHRKEVDEMLVEF